MARLDRADRCSGVICCVVIGTKGSPIHCRTNAQLSLEILNLDRFGYSDSDLGHGHEGRGEAKMLEYAVAPVRIHLDFVDWLVSL